MKNATFYSALVIFLLASVSSAQSGSPNRVLFSHIPDSKGGQIVTVTYTGLENPNLRIFESLVPTSSDAECHSTTDFPAPRVLGPEVASLVFDHSTSTYKLRWATPPNRRDTCRVLRVGQSVDAADLAIWQSHYGSGGFSEQTAGGTRAASLSEVTYTFKVKNTSLWEAGSDEKE